MIQIPQSTSRVVMLKVFLTGTTTAATGKTVAITVSKNGGSFANPNAGATNATEVANGWYKVTVDTTDTGTVGDLVVRGTATSCDDVERIFGVVKATNAGLTALPDTACTTNASLVTAGTGAAQIKLAAGYVAPTWADIAAPTTTVNFSGTTIGTLSTYTGNTPQTGDAYAKVDTEVATLQSDVTAIKAKTDNLPSDPADASDIASSFSTVNSTLSTIAGYIDTEVAAIKAKTDNLPSDPADASDIAAAFSTVNSTLSTIAGYIDTEVAAIKLKTDLIPAAPAAVSDIPTAAQNAAGLLDLAAGVETGLTVRQYMRLDAAAMAGKISGVGTGTVIIRNYADTKDRMTVTIDVDHNRTAIVYDLT